MHLLTDSRHFAAVELQCVNDLLGSSAQLKVSRLNQACALLQPAWFTSSCTAVQKAMQQHAAFRLQLQQQLLREGSKVQSEHPVQKPGLHEQQRCVMPDNRQYEANETCSCTASSKMLRDSSQQSPFSLAGSSYLAPPPASDHAAHDTSVAVDAEECSTAAAAAAQVRSIWTTAGLLQSAYISAALP